MASGAVAGSDSIPSDLPRTRRVAFESVGRPLASRRHMTLSLPVCLTPRRAGSIFESDGSPSVAHASSSNRSQIAGDGLNAPACSRLATTSKLNSIGIHAGPMTCSRKRSTRFNESPRSCLDEINRREQEFAAIVEELRGCRGETSSYQIIEALPGCSRTCFVKAHARAAS